jgi:hypothetical protein
MPTTYPGGLVINDDGSLVVKPGDSLSKYSQALYGNFDHIGEFYRSNGTPPKEILNKDLIHVGETLYHIPLVRDQLRKHALDHVGAFAARTGPQAFTRLTRSVVAHGLRERVLDPTRVNQGAASLCPSANVVYLEARDHPVHYVLFVTQLFEHGRSALRRWRVAPGRALLNYLPPVRGIHEADWVPMASIRESEEWLWSNRDIFSDGGAYCDVIARWLRTAGYTDVADHSQKSQPATEGNLRLAANYYGMGYRVLLNIDAAVLQPTNNRPRDKWMHIATLTSPITFAGAGANRTVDFTVYTWGAQRRMIPAGSSSMQLGDFLAHYYGFVAARF